MPVGADHLAFLDLGQDALPRAVGESLTNAERLSRWIEMVEFEHHRVPLAAIGARVAGEVLKKEDGPLPPEGVFSGACLFHVTALVRLVVSAVIGRPAWPAHVVALASPFAPPGELREGLQLPAASASPFLELNCHLAEHMFACPPDEPAGKLGRTSGRGAVW
jgi:hypothetical protein